MSDWPFDSPPNEAVVTLARILDGRRPILLVSRDLDDGGWRFLDGDAAEEDEGRIVSLDEMYRQDSSISDVADLPEGWTARRESAEHPWRMIRPPIKNLAPGSEVKLHVPGEYFWAKSLDIPGRYVIDNVLLNPDYSLGDVIEADEAGEVVRVIEKFNYSCVLEYSVEDLDKEQSHTRYTAISAYMSDRDILVEGMYAGVAMAAVPLHITPAKLREIVADCPVALNLTEVCERH